MGFESGERRRINQDPSITWKGSRERIAERMAVS